MVYLNYTNLDKETQERLIAESTEHVEHEFGKELKQYAKEHCIDYNELVYQEAVKKLYTYDYVFNI